MALTAGLTLWGWRNGAWEIPALALAGYVGMRAVMAWVPAEYIELSACTLWLMIAAIMVFRGGDLPGFLYALSALTYVVFLTFGFPIKYMGLSPIIAESFAALALLCIGGGIYGMANPAGHSFRSLAWVQNHSVGMARRSQTNACADR